MTESEHVHTEECESPCDTPSHIPWDDNHSVKLTEHLNAEPQKPLTEAQFRKLRGLYFTVRHHRVQPCGHLLDQINEPTFRNCEACWFCFFNSHGQLVEVTDKALQEQGFRFLDKMRGKKYRRAFTSFMSTIARLKKESDEHEARNKAEVLSEEQGVSTSLEQKVEPTESSSGVSISSPMENGESL
jgi:hypothetical protein